MDVKTPSLLLLPFPFFFLFFLSSKIMTSSEPSPTSLLVTTLPSPAVPGDEELPVGKAATLSADPSTPQVVDPAEPVTPTSRPTSRHLSGDESLTSTSDSGGAAGGGGGGGGETSVWSTLVGSMSGWLKTAGNPTSLVGLFNDGNHVCAVCPTSEDEKGYWLVSVQAVIKDSNNG